MKKKILTYNDYLKALGLYTLVENCYSEGQKYELALAKFLGYDETYMGHISDSFFDSRPFEDALKEEGVEIQH